jgi:hypothetical protein
LLSDIHLAKVRLKVIVTLVGAASSDAVGGYYHQERSRRPISKAKPAPKEEEDTLEKIR